MIYCMKCQQPMRKTKVENKVDWVIKFFQCKTCDTYVRLEE